MPLWHSLCCLTDDVGQAIKEVKAGRVEFKMDKTGALAILIGKRSFSMDQLKENAQTALSAVVSSKPNGFKGKFIKSIHLSSTMSPSIKIDLSELST